MNPPSPAVSLPHRAEGGVRFTYRAPPGVQTVSVAGTFNVWRAGVAPLVRGDDDVWHGVVPIAPGRHLYKIVVDGTQWLRDPVNPWEAEDGQDNASLTVLPDGEVFVRDGRTGPQAPAPMHVRHDAVESPDWLRDGVLYQLSVPAFGGTFDGVVARLDHLDALGADIVWLMPVHPIGQAGRRGSLGDPYAVRDFTAIDPALGDAAALKRLVAALHARGKRVVYDWTLNRASRDHAIVATHPHWFTQDAHGEPCYHVPARDEFVGFDFSHRDLRVWLIDAMAAWLREFDFDGLRFDDSDITPTDFLNEIRVALQAVRPDIGLVSQSYDELHHVGACDLTYEGGTRDVITRIAAGQLPSGAYQAYWEASTFSFPRGALRMRWLEDKEQGRATARFGRALHHAAATLVFTLDGVPHLLMGQEFGEPTWATWTSLFEPYRLDWDRFDDGAFAHFAALLRLRRLHPALRQGGVSFEPDLPEGVVGHWRHGADGRIGVFANLSGAPLSLAPQLAALPILYGGSDRDGVMPPLGWRVVHDAA